MNLVRDAANIFDPSAVGVVASVEGKGSALMGFIPAQTAQKLARLMDRGIQFKACLEGLVGGCEGMSYEMRIRVAI